MSQQVDQRTRRWIGRTLIDRAGERIGRVEDIYTDDVGGQPAWIAVATGRFGLNIVFLPFAAASPAPGNELRVPFPTSLIKGAPVAGKGGRLTQDEVVRLYDHYGFDLEAEEVRERAVQRRSTGLRGDYKPASPYVSLPADDPPVPTCEPPASADCPAPAKKPAAAVERVAVPAERPAALVERVAAPAEKPGAAVEPVAATPKESAAPANEPRKRPANSLFRNIVDLTEQGTVRPDSPLFWDHDDRIDSIRPPREPARSGR